MINSFNPVYRISHAAFQYLDRQLKSGYMRHHEVLIPTVLRNNGFTLADLSNTANGLTPVLSVCTLHTMRWKPVVVFPGILRNKLYHPVKAKITKEE